MGVRVLKHFQNDDIKQATPAEALSLTPALSRWEREHRSPLIGAA